MSSGPHDRVHLAEGGQTPLGQPFRIIRRQPDRRAPHAGRRITLKAAAELEEQDVVPLETLALVG
jgi:hypothetical protein